MSHVTCPVSCVTCQVSGVTCHVELFIYLFYKVVELVGGGSVINGSTPSSLDHIVVHSKYFKRKAKAGDNMRITYY